VRSAISKTRRNPGSVRRNVERTCGGGVSCASCVQRFHSKGGCSKVFLWRDKTPTQKPTCERIKLRGSPGGWKNKRMGKSNVTILANSRKTEKVIGWSRWGGRHYTLLTRKKASGPPKGLWLKGRVCLWSLHIDEGAVGRGVQEVLCRQLPVLDGRGFRTACESFSGAFTIP